MHCQRLVYLSNKTIPRGVRVAVGRFELVQSHKFYVAEPAGCPGRQPCVGSGFGWTADTMGVACTVALRETGRKGDRSIDSAALAMTGRPQCAEGREAVCAEFVRQLMSVDRPTVRLDIPEGAGTDGGHPTSEPTPPPTPDTGPTS